MNKGFLRVYGNAEQVNGIINTGIIKSNYKISSEREVLEGDFCDFRAVSAKYKEPKYFNKIGTVAYLVVNDNEGFDITSIIQSIVFITAGKNVAVDIYNEGNDGILYSGTIKSGVNECIKSRFIRVNKTEVGGLLESNSNYYAISDINKDSVVILDYNHKCIYEDPEDYSCLPSFRIYIEYNCANKNSFINMLDAFKFKYLSSDSYDAGEVTDGNQSFGIYEEYYKPFNEFNDSILEEIKKDIGLIKAEYPELKIELM